VQFDLADFHNALSAGCVVKNAAWYHVTGSAI